MLKPAEQEKMQKLIEQKQASIHLILVDEWFHAALLKFGGEMLYFLR